jgi:hypothetical protein
MTSAPARSLTEVPAPLARATEAFGEQARRFANRGSFVQTRRP